MELECPIKEKEDWIALNKGPNISHTRKGGPKKQSRRVLQFLIRVTRVLMCRTSMCAFVLLFWIPYQKREDRIALNKGPTISPAVLWKRNATSIDRKIVELGCPIKEKENQIAFNKGPTISATRKGGPKKQSPRVLQFLIKGTTI